VTRFDGIVNLEVFTPDDSTASLTLLGRVSRIHSLGRLNP
jgi:hypothetical protein